MQVKFYKTSSDGIEQTLLSLCDKLYSSLSSFFVFSPNQGYIDELDRYMWTYSSPKFIPHLQANCAEATMYRLHNNNLPLNCLSNDFSTYGKQDVIVVPINAKCTIEEHLSLVSCIKHFVNTNYNCNLDSLKNICIIFCDDTSIMEKFSNIADLIETLKANQITYNIWDNTNALKTWEKIV